MASEKKIKICAFTFDTACMNITVSVCVRRVTWGPFRYFCSILLRAKNNCQRFCFFLLLLEMGVCVCVRVCACLFACKLQLMIFILLSTRFRLPRANRFRIFRLHFRSTPLSLRLSACPRYLFDCCHVRLFRCRCCCCSSAFLYPAVGHEAKRVS